jgi:NAD(P)-dependent dehydrogenase (short-subunit alcohol dehydrogenase family)
VNIVLTGSSSGIGQALALRLLSRGHQVWGLARSDQAATVRLYPGLFQASRCDVSSWEAVAAAAADVARAWPHADALVTCAGSQGELGRAVAADPAAWSATVRANLDATFFSIRGFHSLLERAPRRAKVVCFSGGGASKARPNFTAYAAAKTAVVRLVETIAEEEKAARLDINALAPGAINTRLTEEVLARGPAVVGPAEFEAAVRQKASGGQSMDKALDAVEWLLSEASDGISGRLLSAPWDPLPRLRTLMPTVAGRDVYMLRRVTPEDLGLKWT